MHSPIRRCACRGSSAADPADHEAGSLRLCAVRLMPQIRKHSRDSDNRMMDGSWLPLGKLVVVDHPLGPFPVDGGRRNDRSHDGGRIIGRKQRWIDSACRPFLRRSQVRRRKLEQPSRRATVVRPVSGASGSANAMPMKPSICRAQAQPAGAAHEQMIPQRRSPSAAPAAPTDHADEAIRLTTKAVFEHLRSPSQAPHHGPSHLPRRATPRFGTAFDKESPRPHRTVSPSAARSRSRERCDLRDEAPSSSRTRSRYQHSQKPPQTAKQPSKAKSGKARPSARRLDP